MMVYTIRMKQPPRLPKRPGRVPGPPTIKATVLLPPDLVDWGKGQPGGLSALIRRLLEEERRKAGQ